VEKRAHVTENHGNAVVYTIGLIGTPHRKQSRHKLAGTSLLPVEYVNKYEKPRNPQLAHKHMCWPSYIIHILKKSFSNCLQRPQLKYGREFIIKSDA
jgi:hypothetical protein